MAATPTGSRELQSLVVRIIMNADDFISSVGRVEKSLGSMGENARYFASRFMGSMNSGSVAADRFATNFAASIQSAVGAAATGTASINASMATVAAAFAPLETTFAAINAAHANLAKLATPGAAALGTLPNDLSAVANTAGRMAGSMQIITQEMGSLSSVSSSISGIAAGMAGAGNAASSFATLEHSLVQLETNLSAVAQLQRPIASLLNTFSTLNSSISGIQDLGSALSGMSRNLDLVKGSLGVDFKESVRTLDSLGRSINRMKEATTGISAAMTRMDKLNDPLTKLPAVITPLDGAGQILNRLAIGIKKLGELSGVDIKDTAKAIGPLGTALNKLPDISTFADSNTNLKNLAAGIKSLSGATSLMGPLKTAVGPLGTALSKLGTGITDLGATAASTGQLSTVFTNLTNLVPGIQASTGAITSFVSSFATMQLDPMENVRKTINGMALGMKRLDTQTGALSKYSADLLKFVGDFGNIASKFGKESRMMGQAFKGVGYFFGELDSLNFRRLPGVLPYLEQFATGFNTIALGLNLPAVSTAGQALNRVGNLLKQVNSYKGGSQGFDDLTTGIGKVFGALGKAGTPEVAIAGTAIDRVASFTRSLTGANIAVLKPLADGVDNLLSKMGAAPADKAMESARALTRVNTALTNMAKVNPASVVAAANSARAAMTILNTVPVSANASRMASVLSRVGIAMKNMGGGGGGMPPNVTFGGMPGGFNNYTAAATRATVATNSFGQALKNMFAASDTAGFTGLQRIQASLAGLGVLGLVQFARMDNELNKVLGHMGDFEGTNRRQFQQGIYTITNRSITGAADLAKGLDKLTSAGMNTAMALNNLATAEDFAVASGMPMQKATTRLVDIMRSMQLEGEGVNDYYKNMIGLADKLVFMASKTGSTEEQMAEAFNARLVTQLHSTKSTLDDALSMVGVYSMVGGETARGSVAGSRIARALTSMTMKGVSGQTMWDNMLGGEARVQGELLPAIDLLEKLGAKMAHLNTTQRAAQMMTLGFESDTVQAIEPLLQNYTALKQLREELQKSGGTSHAVAELYRQGLLNQMKILFNAASSIASVFGDRIAPAFYLVTNAVSALADAFTKLNPAFQSLIVYGSLLLLTFRPIVGMLSGMFISLVGVALSPFRLLGNVIMGVAQALYFVATMPSMIVAGYQYMSGMLLTIWTSVKTAAWATGTWIYTAFSYAWKAIDILSDSMIFLIRNLHTGVTLATNLIANMIMGGANLVTGLLMIGTSLVGIVAALFLIGPLLTLIGAIASAAFAMIGALVLTITMALGQLASLIGAGLVAAWGAFKATAAAAMGAVGSGLAYISSNTSDLWFALKDGLGGFIDNLAESMEKIAGFFWNFKQNMTVIWKWLGDNGKQAFKDIAIAGFGIMEVLGGNMMTIFGAVGEVLKMTLTTAFSAVWGYLRTFFGWFASQWPNMILDIGAVMIGFISGLKTNFINLFDLISALVTSMMEQVKLALMQPIIGVTPQQASRYGAYMYQKKMEEYDAGKIWPAVDRAGALRKAESIHSQYSRGLLETDPEILAKVDRDYFNRQREQIIRSNSFNPVGINTKGMKFQTDFGQLKEGMANRSETIGSQFELLGNVIPQVFKEAFQKANPFSGAFAHIAESPMWQGLLKQLNLDLPTDAWTWMEKLTKRLTGMGEQENMGMAGPGKPSTGFTFKQISEERTMVGGAAYENLEYQQLKVLEAIDKKLGVMAQANGNTGGFSFSWKPVIKD